MHRNRLGYILLTALTLTLVLIGGQMSAEWVIAQYAAPSQLASKQRPQQDKPQPTASADEDGQMAQRPRTDRIALSAPEPEWQPPSAKDESGNRLLAFDVETRQETMLNLVPDDILGAEKLVVNANPSASDTVLGFGSLSQIPNPTQAPWNAVVRLEIQHDELPSGTIYICTGVLIDPKFVLTGSPTRQRGVAGWAV
jgi:V8-like Glu-specific endopeptidase